VPPPAAVVFAECSQDVADAVRLAAQYKVPVIPFGVGSSLEGHADTALHCQQVAL
jgi:D-lactate dehydrogenase (cytochrome)